MDSNKILHILKDRELTNLESYGATLACADTTAYSFLILLTCPP